MIRARRASLDDLECMSAAYCAVREMLLDDTVTTNVAQLDGRIVGFSGLADDGCLDDLWVHPDAWGAGVAPVLVTTHENEQRSIGRTRLTSWVPEDSPRSRGLMAKLAWRCTGRVQPMVIHPEQPNTLFGVETPPGVRVRRVRRMRRP